MGTTAKLALRYPANTGRVADGYLDIQHLAEDVDGKWAPGIGQKVGTDAGTTASTTYTTTLAGSTDSANGTAITVPPNGRIMVHSSALMGLSVGPTGHGYVGLRLSGPGSSGGTVDLADNYALHIVQAPSTSYRTVVSRQYVLGPVGLVVGQLLTVQQVYKVNVGTTTVVIDDRLIACVPIFSAI